MDWSLREITTETQRTLRVSWREKEEVEEEKGSYVLDVIRRGITPETQRTLRVSWKEKEEEEKGSFVFSA